MRLAMFKPILLLLIASTIGCAHRFSPPSQPLTPEATQCLYASLSLQVTAEDLKSPASRERLVQRAKTQNLGLSFHYQHLTSPESCPWNFLSLLTLGILPGICQEETLVRLSLNNQQREKVFTYTVVSGLLGVPALILSVFPDWQLGTNDGDPLPEEYGSLLNEITTDSKDQSHSCRPYQP